ncbi:MAG TPA: LacI family DNA-binding transcriptional regulator [Mycobacterium sp.]|jgi:hypothetical protein|uniref:LacI family DNA-binding transcriptional regulator n=1 Tax=Mycobacterium sp. TaxID=1785 RepID=UPI002F41A926
MAYAERVPSPKGAYYRGRYKAPDGSWLTVRDEHNEVIRFEKKADAKLAGQDRESDVRGGRWKPSDRGQTLFRGFATDWHAGLELSWSTIINYRHHLEDHLIPFFGEYSLAEIDKELIGKWKRHERSYGYSEASISSWHGTLSNCLGDAVPKHIDTNPCARKRGKGRKSGARERTGTSQGRDVPVAGPLEVLLIAERMSILTGRDDEFVMTQTGFWGALRMGELIGLEREYVLGRQCRAKGILRVKWQLYELSPGGYEELREQAPGGFLRCPPKDDSYGDVPLPPFMRVMLEGHAARVPAVPCPCHGRAYMFRGWQEARRQRGNVPLKDIAALAGVTNTAVSAVLGRSDMRIRASTRERVLRAAEASGWQPAGEGPEGPAPHWRRSSIGEKFTAAATGIWPGRKRNDRVGQAVTLRGDWPGELVSGKNAASRAEWCWMPVTEPGVHPHLERHWVKTWMEEVGTPEILSESVLRHRIPGISGAYRHVSPEMLARLSAAQTEAWEAALDARLEMSERSPVAVLDEMLRQRLEARKPRLVPSSSPGTAKSVVQFEGRTLSDQRRSDRR